MKVKVEKSSLSEAIRKVNKILFDEKDALHLKVYAGKLEISRKSKAVNIISVIPAEGFDENFELTVGAAKFTSLLSKMIGDFVVISKYSESSCRIACGKTRLSLAVIPGCWETLTASGESVKFHDIQSSMMKVMHGLSSCESNHYCKNINLEFCSSGYRLTSTDGHKISIRETVSKDKVTGSFMVPGDICKTMSAILKEDVTMTFDGKLVTFSDGDTWLTSPIPFGKYPALEQKIRDKADEMPYTIAIDKAEFIGAIEIAQVISHDIVLVIGPDKLMVKGQESTAFGDTSIAIEYKLGARTTDERFVFNSELLLDAVKSIPDDVVMLQFESSRFMILMQGDHYLELVCPKLKEGGR